MFLRCGKYHLSLDRPLLMGIVNVTPDSFSDGGRFQSVAAAIEHGRHLIAEGADMLDIGGESTRPGAGEVGVEEELRRVIPVIEGLIETGVPLSIDTQKPLVMRAAIAAGASIVNDVNALRQEGALEVCADSQVGVCLMHMQGTPGNMQTAPVYADVASEVRAFLLERVAAVQAAGIARERLVIDPGFGFGKTREHNLALLRSLALLVKMGIPVLVGLSRKSFLGAVTGRDVNQRVWASVAAALIAAQKGAHILRVHDVGATRDAFAVLKAVEEDNNG